MEYIARSQYRLLKKLYKKDLLKSQLTENEMRDIHYLGQNDCIEYEDVSENDYYIYTIDTDF